MDYRLDRVRIIKDADNKVIVANRGFPVCLHPPFLYLLHISTTIFARIMKHLKQGTVELVIIVISIILLILGTFHLVGMIHGLDVSTL